MGIPFVDAHVHFWDLARIKYPWLTPPFTSVGPNGSVAAIAQDYLPADYRADLDGWSLAGAVHIDAGAHPEMALAETEWLEAQADETGLPTAIVAFAPLHDPDLERTLERQAAHPQVRGIRQIVNWHTNPLRTYTPSDVTQDDAWWAGFGLLARYGLSFDLQCYAGQMAGLAPLIARHEDVPVIINHLGMPVLEDREGVTRWRHGMRTLAALPHVAVKISGFGFIDRNWDVARVLPFVLEAIELFGTNRCMFASDVPTDKLFAPVERYLSAFKELSSGCSEAEQRDLFGRNANRIYRLGLTL